ncbi:hypothetical protein [Sphaerimonospora thailandensis]|nr:hypothetical protein [Sphaerimonospora thailandensis]
MDTPTAEFLPGLTLSRILYEEAVRPILEKEHPGLRYAAARVGPGSEVLGFDTARSTDHDWGPRLELFLTPEDAAAHAANLHRLLAYRLPKQIRGWPTHFQHRHPGDPVGHMEVTDGPVDHRVSITTVDTWLSAHLGLHQETVELTVGDWLAMP